MTYIYGHGWYICTSWKVEEYHGTIYMENPDDENDVIFINKTLVKEIVRND